MIDIYKGEDSGWTNVTHMIDIFSHLYMFEEVSLAGKWSLELGIGDRVPIFGLCFRKTNNVPVNLMPFIPATSQGNNCMALENRKSQCPSRKKGKE